MTTALQRLLKYPHAAVFDTGPDAELALRVRHPAGATWAVADETLTVSAGGESSTYDLASHTVGSLAAALQDDGYEVAYLSPTFSPRGASVLVEGAGDQLESNGDHLEAFKSPMWMLFGGYAREIREAEYQAHQALRQMVITQAEGEWLDLWGMLYAEARLPGEQDADYSVRIPKEAFRIRVNRFAIEQAIKDRTGYDVEIREPWRRMFTLDVSQLSGDHHFPDERFYSYFVIHPVARSSIDWSTVLPVIHRNRAAGIEVYSPSVELPARHVIAQPPAEYLAAMGGHELRAMSTWPSTEAPLGVMRLDDNEIGLNHPAMVYELRTYANADGIQTVQVFGDPRDVAVASIALSDGVPLGDENAILSRGMLTTEAVPPETMSDELAPSDYVIARRLELVDLVTIEQHGALLEFDMSVITVGSAKSSETTFTFSADRVTGDDWTGAWDDRGWYGAHIVMGMARTNTPVGDILNDTLILNLSEIS